MAQISKSSKLWLPLSIWAAGLVLFGALGLWNLQNFREAGEDRMINEAGRIAAQMAGLMTIPGLDADPFYARTLVRGAMEDDRVYAIKIDVNTDVMEGQRRNYLWEPVPWDEEIMDNCVQGMTPIRMNGEIVGKVDVWLSTRLEDEENALQTERELWRFGLTAMAWTGVLLFIFWQWGGIRKMHRNLQKKELGNESRVDPEEILFNMENGEKTAGEDDDEIGPCVVNARLGRYYQRTHPDAWLVTAGMFRQTFARGPALASRLYADGETAGLCHLGRMLEQAAPCVGAEKLLAAAREMQAALNDPDCQSQARFVEDCVVALEEVLDSLCGNGQWRSKPGMTR